MSTTSTTITAHYTATPVVAAGVQWHGLTISRVDWRPLNPATLTIEAQQARIDPIVAYTTPLESGDVVLMVREDGATLIITTPGADPTIVDLDDALSDCALYERLEADVEHAVRNARCLAEYCRRAYRSAAAALGDVRDLAERLRQAVRHARACGAAIDVYTAEVMVAEVMRMAEV